MMINLLDPLRRPPQPPYRDPFERAAVELVKSWVGEALGGQKMIDRDDAPIIQLSGPVCESMAEGIADLMRRADRGEIR